ncbi:MAG: alpha/beta hydrolase [Chloroflexi bacterium]|nr:alpha/beta hydrolase [Chloroflexota bacterium]
MRDDLNTDEYLKLDRPDIIRFIFYPRQDFGEAPSGSTDYSIPVDKGISIGCRFYVHSKHSPSILFFHGNGEVVTDYDYTAPLYNEAGINLFVADYRGYGSSGGTPSFTGMVRDAHCIFRAFVDVLQREHYSGGTFVMGRSLGSMSAIELASVYQSQLKGLIVESGFASVVRLLRHLGLPAEFLGLSEVTFPNATKMRTISLPTLIIHGDYDTIIPVSEGIELFENAVAKDKHLVIIKGAGHNDIMMVGLEEYFGAIKEFVSGEK